MNDLPANWSELIQKAYPTRSGPSGWRGMRLMLAIRRALMESTFEEILDGCEKYKAFCQQSGIEGSIYVQAPIRFIEDGCYLEDFVYVRPEKPEVIEARNKEADRWRRASEAAAKLSPPLEAYPGESVGAFETRVALTECRGPARRSQAESAQVAHGGESSRTSAADLHGRIASLAERLKIAR